MVESIVCVCDIEGVVGLDVIMGNVGFGRDICVYGYEFVWYSGVVNLWELKSKVCGLCVKVLGVGL